MIVKRITRGLRYRHVDSDVIWTFVTPAADKRDGWVVRGSNGRESLTDSYFLNNWLKLGLTVLVEREPKTKTSV